MACDTSWLHHVVRYNIKMGVDVTYQNGGERGESIDDLAKAHHEHRVHRQIEHFLGGKVLQASATPAAEHVLFDQALQHRIVYTSRSVVAWLTGLGLSAELQYCTSDTHGHPVPFVMVRDISGALVVPCCAPDDVQLGGSELRVIDCEQSPHGECEIAKVVGSSKSSAQPTMRRSHGAVVVIPSRTNRNR